VLAGPANCDLVNTHYGEESSYQPKRAF
jgi:hypothetical protein